MERLIELANQIKDNGLRKRVVDFLKNPSLSHKEFKKYPKEDLKKAVTPFSVGGAGTVKRDVLNHTIAVTELCIKTAEVAEKNFGVKVNKDYLIAGAVLHDMMKLFEWKLDEDGDPMHTGVLLDHSFLGVAELYAKGFPERVIHMVASHFGEHGPTPPRNFEALILHHVDNMLAVVEFHQSGGHAKEHHMPIVVLDEDTIKKLRESKE
jgi:7,8-dihydroneopterin 2',3'-cyclic phosphate phosphodiesterase